MFIKYLKTNIKKHSAQYLFIIAFEVFLLLAILISNGIYLDSVSNENFAKYWATLFDFSFSTAKTSSEISDKLEKFADSIPYEYDYMSVYITANSDDQNENGTAHTLFIFSDYEHLKKHLLKYFVKSESDLPTEEQYNDGEKMVLVGNKAGSSIYTEDGVFTPEFKYDDYGNIISFGETYSVCGRFNGDGIVFFWGSQPKNALITGFQFQMTDIIGEKQSQEICDLYYEIFGDEPGYSKIPEMQGLLEQRADSANILISALLILISVLNIMLVFRYLIMSRRKCFAVFRFCGFNKSVCLKYSFGEFMLISLIASVVAVCVFDQLIKPFMVNYYNIFGIVFTAGYYLQLFGMYIAASVIMFFIYIAPALSKSVTSELRGI